MSQYTLPRLPAHAASLSMPDTPRRFAISFHATNPRITRRRFMSDGELAESTGRLGCRHRLLLRSGQAEATITLVTCYEQDKNRDTTVENNAIPPDVNHYHKLLTVRNTHGLLAKVSMP